MFYGWCLTRLCLYILSTKTSQNSDQILRFMKIFIDFQIVFLPKYSEKNLNKSVQPAAPIFFSQEISHFFKKELVGSKFCYFFQKKSKIFVDRI